MPRQIYSRDDLHTAGIFGLDATESRVLTASKDGCVALSDLHQAAQITCIHSFDNIHNGVVKYVQWRGENSFASCGNDRFALCFLGSTILGHSSNSLFWSCPRSIQVVDVRKRRSAISLEDAHNSPVNFVSTSPKSDEVVLSASADPVLRLFDIRSPERPLFEYDGHTPVARCSNIYKPTFWLGGKQVATGGEKTNQMSFYCTETGR